VGGLALGSEPGVSSVFGLISVDLGGKGFTMVAGWTKMDDWGKNNTVLPHPSGRELVETI
jgi:hypothetical protein